MRERFQGLGQFVLWAKEVMVSLFTLRVNGHDLVYQLYFIGVKSQSVVFITGAFTGMVIKNDPGQNLIWIAFASLISGLLLTFYFPRRRVWARLEGGTARLAMLGDRYVDVPRELGRLTDEVRLRGAATVPN